MISDFPVFRNPSQLLRYLGLSGPDAPNRVNDYIQGQLNLLPWWLAAAEQNLSVTFTPGAGVTGFLSAGAAAVVPLNQRWIVSNFTAGNAANAAAHSLGYTCGYLQSTPQVGFALGNRGQFAALEAGAVDGFAGTARNSWLLLGPADVFGVWIHNNVGAAPALMSTSIRYSSFPV